MKTILAGVFALWATALGPALKHLDLRPHASHRIEIAIRDNSTGKSTKFWLNPVQAPGGAPLSWSLSWKDRSHRHRIDGLFADATANSRHSSNITIRWSDNDDQVNVAARQDGLEINFTV